ncbi:MAG: molybdopterin-dependent oxidoreductase, partial [Gammaproteobacteria bacterium]|nr:molybdopterin-dependent oxidoreductase [Gammaproteobacteria bacterium]
RPPCGPVRSCKPSISRSPRPSSGIRPEDVAINTQWAGGSFGRRAVYNADYVAEAANIVKALGTEQPVKLVWTREDDIKGGYYRPMYVHKVRVGLTEAGDIAGWQHRVVASRSWTARRLPILRSRTALTRPPSRACTRRPTQFRISRWTCTVRSSGLRPSGGAQSATPTLPMQWKR